MSVPVLDNLDLNKNQLLNALLQVIAGDHGSPVEGIIWYDSTADRVKYRDGVGIQPLTSAADLATQTALLQLRSEKDQNNGYAGLDAGGKIPAARLPTSAMEYQGVWNASTNTPALADGTGSSGDTYRVTAAASRNLGSGVIDWAVGDLVIYDGAVWQKSDSADAVTSVAGKVGVVSLVKADVGLGSVDNTSDAGKPVSTAQQTALDLKAPLASPTFTGSPAAPTPTPGDNDTSIATTAFVTAAITAVGGIAKYAVDITGNAALTQFTVTHNRNTKDISVTVWDVANDIEVIVDKKAPTVNTARIDFATPPANGKVYRVVVIG
jgi:hypothetical protein